MCNMVRKDKHLVLAKNNWNEIEGKLFATLIKQLNPKFESDFKPMKITIDELEQIWGDKKIHTSRIKETCYDLQTKAYEIPLFKEDGKTKRGYKYFSLFHNIVYEFDKKYIKFQFHDDMKPYLIDFANQFVNYDISNIIQFKSKYTLSFYEYFKLQTQFKKEPLITEVISIPELREWLNLDKNRDNITNKYTRVYDLKKYILDKVKKDMLHSDIRMDYSIIKEGRYPSHIKFNFVKKQNEESSLFKQEAKNLTNNTQNNYKPFAVEKLYLDKIEQELNYQDIEVMQEQKIFLDFCKKNKKKYKDMSKSFYIHLKKKRALGL